MGVFLFLFLVPLLAACRIGPLTAYIPGQGDEDGPQVLAHYMPWYASKDFSGRWGWHWTMNHFDPDTVDGNGRRQIASHYYPLVGPYDSNDPDLLEYQVLLMKYAGIDGVIVDWYGIRDYFDYAQLHRNTLHLVEYVKKAGLKFAVCYEDQTVKHMVSGGALEAGAAVPHGKEVMRWLQENWFGDEAYVRVNGRPLLLVFGPQHFADEEWPALLEGLEPRPLFYTLNRARGAADGAFGWPPVHGGDTTGPDEWQAYLDRLYAAEGRDAAVGAAFPKFHDIYRQAGLHDSYGYLDDGGGSVFGETLERARRAGVRLIQAVTWNDYGEGTVIEPTVEYGYRYVEEVQRFKDAPYGLADLRLPVLLYELRKWGPGDRTLQARLDEAAGHLFAGRIGPARETLLDLKGARDH